MRKPRSSSSPPSPLSKDLHIIYTKTPTRSSKTGPKYTLSEEECKRVEKLTVEYLVNHSTIKNRELRALGKVAYDQATWFFGQMVKRGKLRQVGSRGATKYVLSRR